MSNEITDVTLKFPCAKKWDEMKIVDGGRHCDTCHHKVVDFRNMSQEQFHLYLSNNQHVCGIFKKSQLSQRFLRYAAASVMAASLTATAACSTNENETTSPAVEEKELLQFRTTGIVVVDSIPPPLIEQPDTMPTFEFIDVGTVGMPVVDLNDSIPSDEGLRE